MDCNIFLTFEYIVDQLSYLTGSFTHNKSVLQGIYYVILKIFNTFWSTRMAWLIIRHHKILLKLIYLHH